MTKQEKIQEKWIEAIGIEKYTEVKNCISNNGFLKLSTFHFNKNTQKDLKVEIRFDPADEDRDSWRPRTLEGIEKTMVGSKLIPQKHLEIFQKITITIS